MTHVFISYVKENEIQVQRLCHDLIKNGVKVWLDQVAIAPGDKWKRAIRTAIRTGNFFIACFSKEYQARNATYMNEEIKLAVEELRQHPVDRKWFIPVLLSVCQIPDWDIGPGETLRDIQYVPLYQDWDKGVQRILSVIGPPLSLIYTSHSDSHPHLKEWSFKEPYSFDELFLENIDLLLDDLDLERKNIKLDFYFDSYHVNNMVLGMYAFYDESRLRFDHRRFDQKETLVQCLAASGWLHEIRMLPPHQAEFLTLLARRQDSNIPKSHQLREVARDFLSEIGVQNVPDVDFLSDEELVEFVHQQVGGADKLYKAVECLRHGSWIQRLLHLKKSDLLQFESFELDPMELINSDAFIKLKHSLDFGRPGKLVSNFADAYAITTLIKLLQQYNAGKSNRIPRFLPSSQFLSDCVKDAGVEYLLTYRNQKDKPLSVIRQPDYFLYRCLFRPPEKYKAVAKLQGYNLHFINQGELEKLRSQIANIVQFRKQGDIDFDKMLSDRKPLGDILEQLNIYSFFENVWLPFSAEEDTQYTIGGFVEAAYSLDDERFRNQVTEAIEEIKKELLESVREYEQAKDSTGQQDA